jgi:hypothetical protein
MCSREAMKTKVKICFSAVDIDLTKLQSNTNMAQTVWSIVLAQQLKCSSAAPTNHNYIWALAHNIFKHCAVKIRPRKGP